MNGYKAFYRGSERDVYADTLYEAKQKAVALFKAPKKQEHMVSVMLCEKDVDPATGKGTQYLHSTASVG
jgi:hypothetical protein